MRQLRPAPLLLLALTACTLGNPPSHRTLRPPPEGPPNLALDALLEHHDDVTTAMEDDCGVVIPGPCTDRMCVVLYIPPATAAEVLLGEPRVSLALLTYLARAPGLTRCGRAFLWHDPRIQADPCFYHGRAQAQWEGREVRCVATLLDPAAPADIAAECSAAAAAELAVQGLFDATVPSLGRSGAECTDPRAPGAHWGPLRREAPIDALPPSAPSR